MTASISHFQRAESQIKSALQNTIVSMMIAILEVSCASAPPTIVHETIGPAAAAPDSTHEGYLTVYSATAWATNDDGPSLLNHTDYEIYSADGNMLEQVANHEEDPARVTLPKGSYMVVAASDDSGIVRVPVAIETGKTTVVNLESGSGWQQTFAGIANGDLVRLPNGQPVGYRARPNELSKSPLATVAHSKHQLTIAN